ncbi:amidase [Piscinibacter sakaiensis]|uniref:Asp-tRNAAsn/glu-tRNAGln amidotransferase A subunit n=1 Tax=Piscinibacter sakaiensis TaxID=1547922 RepID=A0A0K8P7B5_PISS1|nr:amidase [Piscinibacter sakaiensis]GAP38404.1 Asp-tRNAAsn/glu-tRNAGln amidotransferase A subunit [Piscinibacter sakaiensis]
MPSPPPSDLTAARDAILAGHLTARAALEDALACAGAAACSHAFLARFDASARAEAAAADARLAAGAPLPPLAGLAVSVKGLFDVQGQVTTAGSRVLADAPPAAADATAVGRLRAAGAALVGHTNLSEFAFSGVGINPHHGTPVNPATAALGLGARIPGGSTSGGAVSVATGAAWAALGSDTGGSIRIPAALQGLVGFKNTARRTPAQGAIPLSTTLDTVCAITRSVRDAARLHGLLAGEPLSVDPVPLPGLRLAVPRTLMLDALEPAVASAFERTLDRLRAAGARVEEIAAPALAEVAAINAGGGFSPVEAWAWHRARLAQREADYDPRVAARIRRGAAMSGADYVDLLRARRDWIARMTQALAAHDAWLSPTVPVIAPPLQPLVDDDAAFFATNAALLRNPSVVNLLDGCALSLPCQAAGEAPVGLMVWHGADADARVLGIGRSIEALLAAHAAAWGG